MRGILRGRTHHGHRADAFPGLVDEPPYRALFAGLEEGVVLADSSGVIVAHNAAAERILGLGAGDLRGRAVADPRWEVIREDGERVPAEQLPLHLTATAGEQHSAVVLGFRRPDGALRWLSVSSRALDAPSADPKAALAVACFVDVTERVVIERELRMTQARLRSQEARVGSFEWDIAADRVVWSPELYAIFAVAPRDFVATRAGALSCLPPRARRDVSRWLDEALENMNGVPRTVRVQGADPRRTFEATAVLERGADGAPLRMTGTVRDVTGDTPSLTPRQREILELLSRGYTGSEVAELLYLSPETVRTHIRNATEKLGAHTRAEAIALALARREIGGPGAFAGVRVSPRPFPRGIPASR